MGVNLDKPSRWKADIARSVDTYNKWFLRFAPVAFRETRIQTTKEVRAALETTKNLTDVSPSVLSGNPKILATLRMSTCPPLAVDRLIGLAGVSDRLVKSMEKEGRIPDGRAGGTLRAELRKIGDIIEHMADPDIFVWLNRKDPPAELEVERAATVVADRLCGSVANPIIRNAQEKRQLAAIKSWLETRGYRLAVGMGSPKFDSMAPGTFCFRMNVPVKLRGGRRVNIPVDAAVMRKTARKGKLPLLFEAKSAGDFANVNKRRKEEAAKMAQLRHTYGKAVRYCLFLCGYFDTGYLGYEAAEGIDWVWEHRIDELAKFRL